MSRQLHILSLPSWYPVRQAPLNGIFNRELATLISQNHKVSLLHLSLDTAMPQSENVYRELAPGFMELTVYLNGAGSPWMRQFRYFKAFFFNVRKIIRERGRPDIIHAQVAWKMGFMGWLLKIRYGIPLVITEHYTGYLPSDGALRGWKKWMSVFALKRADAVTAVSNGLAEAIRNLGVSQTHTIANRLDPVFFETEVPEKKPENAFVLMHVSNFDDRQKQTSIILDQFQLLHQKYPQTELHLIVPKEKYSAYLRSSGRNEIQGITLWQPEDGRALYAKRILQSNAMISFSKFETFGLTIAEALCLGIPVIYTACGGPEDFVESGMGLQCDSTDPHSLYLAMEQMLNQYIYNQKEIATIARKKFNEKDILERYSAVFLSCLKN